MPLGHNPVLLVRARAPWHPSHLHAPCRSHHELIPPRRMGQSTHLLKFPLQYFDKINCFKWNWKDFCTSHQYHLSFLVSGLVDLSEISNRAREGCFGANPNSKLLPKCCVTLTDHVPRGSMTQSLETQCQSKQFWKEAASLSRGAHAALWKRAWSCGVNEHQTIWWGGDRDVMGWIVSPKMVCSSPNARYLRTWPYWEIGLLHIHQLRWVHTGLEGPLVQHDWCV